MKMEMLMQEERDYQGNKERDVWVKLKRLKNIKSKIFDKL